MLDFYTKIGKMALGSRLRRLGERLADQAVPVYALYGNEMQPKWLPVFYALSEGPGKSITQIAQEIGHSHPSVSQIVGQMSAKGYLRAVRRKTGELDAKVDGRKNVVTLTVKGKALHESMRDQQVDVGSAVEDALRETKQDLWEAIREWEVLLDEQDLLRRVKVAKDRREAFRVQITDYTPAYREAFKTLNERWISAYFTMEPEDHKYLDHPQEYILDAGGHIFMALLDGKPVGTCALVPREPGVHELAKMAVAPEAQGKRIGWLLGQAAIRKGEAVGLSRIYLESNTLLQPAIHLYYKLGFQKIIGVSSPYQRSNIQMELILPR